MVAGADFREPPEPAKPWAYWFWINGNITREGITADLEAMKRVGIGEGYIGIIHGMSTLPANPQLKPLGDAWWETITQAIREGGRCRQLLPAHQVNQLAWF